MAAQGVIIGNRTCEPAKGTNEYDLLSFYTAPISFSPGGFVERLSKGSIQLSVEATYVPSPSASVRQPEECYGQRKDENTDLSPVFPRPRLAIGLPASLVFEVSYLPPITVADATPNLLSVSLARVQDVNEGPRPLTLALRVHGTVGRVRGPITCPSDVLQQRSASVACYGREESEDTFRPNMFGGEVALATRSANGRMSAYAGAGATRIVPRFKVGFEQIDNYLDETRIRIDRTIIPVFAGGSYRLAGRAAVGVEVYAVAGDMVTGRLTARYGIR
jgi:hypothetical protein